MRATFLKGLAAVLPTALTVLILVKLYGFVSKTMGSWMKSLLACIIAFATDRQYEFVKAKLPPSVGVVLAVVVALIIIYFMGLALALFMGRRFYAAVEGRLRRVPIINTIYPAVKQVTDFFFADSTMAFRRVVMLEYPRKGIFSVGFVTNKGLSTAERVTGLEMVTVFVPSSPTPFTGYCVQVPRDELIELSLPVDAALKYVISGGVILPVEAGELAGQDTLSVPSMAARSPEYPENENGNKEE